ncbi:MAG: hypothetical protein PHT59_05210 [Candidatus Omnitrophica bacterium]|nr:hypothetical protein [Candidatus Omnitrophota bacterium]
MKKTIVLGFLASSAAAHCCAQSDQTDSVTIATYYPSPYGVYTTVRLVPGAEPLNPLVRRAGTLYVNNTDDKLYLFNGTHGAWEKAGGKCLSRLP